MRKQGGYARQNSGNKETNSQSYSSNSPKKSKRWVPYTKLEIIQVDDSSPSTHKFSNQYHTMMSLLDRLEGRAGSAMVLRNTAKVIGSFAAKMKDEMPMYKELLTGESPEESDGETELLQEQQEIANRLDLEIQLSGVSERRNERMSSLAIDPENVVKTFPKLESTIYKLGRRLRLVAPGAEDSLESKMMIYLAAIDLLEDLRNKLKGLVSPLGEIEFTGSKNEANLSERVIENDYQDLVKRILETLSEMQDNDDADTLGIGDRVYNIIDGINQGQENCEQPQRILDNCKEDLENIVSAIANKCDEDIAEIKEEELLLGQFQYKSDFGDTFKGAYQRSEHTQTIFAKAVSFREDLSARSRRELQVEINGLRRFNHDNLISFIGTGIRDGELYLVWDFYLRTLRMALFEEHTRAELQKNDFMFSNAVAMRFACDILRALDFLHSNGVVHQDLTTTNVVLKNDLSGVRVGDFSFVDGKREVRRVADSDEDGGQPVDFAVTYRAPETLIHNHRFQGQISVYTSDIYSFGVILFELVEKRKAYENLTTDAFRRRVLSNKPKRPNFSEQTAEEVPQMLKAIINKCWQQKPEVRPNAAMLLEELTFQIEGKSEEELDTGEEEDAEGEEKPLKRQRSATFVKWLPTVTDSTEVDEEAE